MYTSRQRNFIFLYNSLLLVIAGSVWLADKHFTTSMAAYLGLGWLALALVPPRLLDLPALVKYRDTMLVVAKNGKWLGLSAAFWFTLHAASAAFGHTSPADFFGFIFSKPVILGFASLLVFWLLAALSNR